MPIFWYCTYDWEHPKDVLLTQPKLYNIGLNNMHFNPIVFWFEYFNAIWHGAMLLFLSFYTLSESSSLQLHIDLEGNKIDNMLNGGLDLNGLFIFQAIVVLVNIKLLVHSNTYSPISLFLQLGSIAFFYFVLWVVNLYSTTDLFGLFRVLFNFRNQWFLLFFFTTSSAPAPPMTLLGQAPTTTAAGVSSTPLPHFPACLVSCSFEAMARIAWGLAVHLGGVMLV